MGVDNGQSVWDGDVIVNDGEWGDVMVTGGVGCRKWDLIGVVGYDAGRDWP